MGVRELSCEDESFFELAQDCVKCRTSVLTVFNLMVMLQ
jgi:hypothetical protein